LDKPITGEHEIWPQETRNIALSFVQNVFWCLGPFTRASPVWQTDRRTDGQTDRHRQGGLYSAQCSMLII